MVSGCAIAAARDVPAISDLRVAGAIDLPAQSRPLKLTGLGCVLHVSRIDVIDSGVGDQFVVAHGIPLN